jgi:hypothetical protein
MDFVACDDENENFDAALFGTNERKPALIVNDLKQPVAAGAIALWVGPGTVAHFADLNVTPQRSVGFLLRIKNPRRCTFVSGNDRGRSQAWRTDSLP